MESKLYKTINLAMKLYGYELITNYKFTGAFDDNDTEFVITTTEDTVTLKLEHAYWYLQGMDTAYWEITKSL